MPDDKKNIIKQLSNNISKYDVIMTTGGASVGEEDYLINILKELGKIIFWKTAIKPGRPLAFGKINKTIIICLPGNQVSVHLLYGMIVKPFFKYLLGSKLLNPRSLIATVNFSMRKKNHRLEWIRVNIYKKTINSIVVNKYPKQGSGMISSIAFSDGIIEIPENISQINKGDKFNFYLFNDLFK